MKSAGAAVIIAVLLLAELTQGNSGGLPPPRHCQLQRQLVGNTDRNKGLSVLDYHSYMARLLAAEESTPLCSPGANNTDCTCDLAEYPGKGQTAWANALIGRIFWDFLREKHWADAVSHKIQKKLSKIRLPYFMNELTLTELDMGSSMPQITATSSPEVNSRGEYRVEIKHCFGPF
uniref:SMP-LTD domain-containing protein n=1 Tax=Amphilophus citrinellus TaxID=61819 RepID=A0A3Q0R3Y0_AMPCI